MKKKVDLRDLLRALHSAVLEAQIMLEQQHIRQLDRYFLEDGTPRVRRIKLPDIRPGATAKWRDFDISLFSLVPKSSIELNHLLVEFQANACEVTDQGESSLLLSFNEVPDPAAAMKFRVSFQGIPNGRGSLQLSDVSMTPVAPEEEKPDDLGIITGIGPKVMSLLYSAGVRTYAQLSKKSVEELRQMLKNAGINPRLNNPTTWPDQAAKLLREKNASTARPK